MKSKKISKEDIEEVAENLYGEVSKRTKGKKDNILFFLAGILGALMLFGGIQYKFTFNAMNTVVEEVDTFTETVDCIITGCEKQSRNNGVVKYITYVEYNGDTYKLYDTDIYWTYYKEDEDIDVDGELTITIYDDGTIEYEITAVE